MRTWSRGTRRHLAVGVARGLLAALIVGALIVGALIAITGPAAEAKGQHGPVAWGGSPVSCSYAGQRLSRLRVTPPRAEMDKALARAGGTAQYVGVRALLQGSKRGHWHTIIQRPGKREYAATVLVHPRRLTSVRHAALLTFRGSRLRGVYTAFRVKVTLQWYAYDGKHVRGSASRVMRACPRIAPAPPPHVTQIDAGYGFACARMSDATVRCWGSNANGRLGLGSTAPYALRPTTVPGLTGVSSIAVGYDYACSVSGLDATLYGGVGKCWGNNAAGQLGDGTTVARSTPTPVEGLTDVVRLYTDRQTTCAVARGAYLQCWGLDNGGQVGDGQSTNTPTPKTLSGLSYVTSATTGNVQACSVSNVSVVWCWGHNDYMQLGISPADGSVHKPTKVTVPGASMLASGGENVCAVVTNGAVRCWGAGNQGQLGEGKTANSATPVTAVGLTGVTSISAMNNSVCAVADGSVYCWGGNASGQLGLGDVNARSTPQRVMGPSGVVGVAVGNAATYAWDGAGRVWAWGDNTSGALGNGGTTNTLTPVPVSVH